MPNRLVAAVVGRARALRATDTTSFLRSWFGTPVNTLLTLIAIAFVIAVVPRFLGWALLDATWIGDASDCHAGGGACWSFIRHKLRFILFGLYPPAQHWRPLGATAVLLALVAVTASPGCWKRWLLGAWALALPVAFWLMRGGLGIDQVAPRLWGGLPVTLMLTAIGLAAGFPLGVLLALWRRSPLPVPRLAAAGIVEVVRGVPLIAVLYIAALVFPLALPTGLDVDKLFLAQASIAVFAAAYFAEAVRGGLQMVPSGQMDAALALGLRRWQAIRLLVLPQALKIAIPSSISITVGFFQDTSLVVIIGLFDLLNTARLAPQDADWLGFHDEAYVFVALIYFSGSAALSRYGLWLEHRTSPERSTGGRSVH